MEDIKLNFIPLLNQDSGLCVFRRLTEDSSLQLEDGCYRAKLPPSEDTSEDYLLYDISAVEKERMDEYSCSYRTNKYLSQNVVFEQLKCKLNREWDIKTSPYEIEKENFRREIDFIISENPYGKTIVTVRPYFLESVKKLGFLITHRFKKKDKNEFGKAIQIESLSLDAHGKQNVFIYRDKQKIILDFLIKRLSGFLDGSKLALESQLVCLKSEELNRKMYMVGNGQTSSSQFMGIKNIGPYKRIDDKVEFVFVFSERTRGLARDVYSGLLGKLYPGQFPGLGDMFKLDFGADNVEHVLVELFEQTNLEKFGERIEKIKTDNADKKIMLVVVLPKGYKGNDQAYDAYGHLKLLALKKKLYCQFITEDTFIAKDSLKWSISNIGLQIFCKLGGIPWLVKPAKQDCLIFGIGSAHEIADGIIKKYSAYTVCLDSTGRFNYIKPLSSSKEESGYLSEFKIRLQKILNSDIGQHYQTVVVHIPHKIRKNEIEAIKSAVEDSGVSQRHEFILIRINTEHSFMGFSDHNTRVPLESSLLKLSHSEYLLWAEGLQDGKKVLHKRTASPLFIDFMHQPESWDSKKEALQDILNLTGANWRGFNAKSQPISIYYSQLISKFMKEFSHLDEFSDVSIVQAESIAPWFL